jgi:hypothetical protein
VVEEEEEVELLALLDSCYRADTFVGAVLVVHTKSHRILVEVARRVASVEDTGCYNLRLAVTDPEKRQYSQKLDLSNPPVQKELGQSQDLDRTRLRQAKVMVSLLKHPHT